MIPSNQSGTISQDRTLSQNGRDITQLSLPDIIRAKYHTQTVSTSTCTLQGQYLPWSDFENEVRRNFERQKWGNSILSVRRVIPEKFDLANEIFQCGDELSLSGRFVQQVLHVMTAVGRDLNIPIKFGDFRTVYTQERENKRLEQEKRAGTPPASQTMSESENPKDSNLSLRKDPDFAAVNNHDRVRFVGEIKTPWTQNFEKNQHKEMRWRRWIGTCSLGRIISELQEVLTALKDR
jgi:hypothetical protein